MKTKNIAVVLLMLAVFAIGCDKSTPTKNLNLLHKTTELGGCNAVVDSRNNDLETGEEDKTIITISENFVNVFVGAL